MLQMFIMRSCPHCKRAIGYINELKQENAKYEDVDITMIDENEEAELASKFDYYFVPCCYVDGCKVHEGVASKDDIKNVLDKALEK